MIELILMVIYLLPTFIGMGKKNILAIFMMNLLLGWTVIFWIFALIWACMKD